MGKSDKECTKNAGEQERDPVDITLKNLINNSTGASAKNFFLVSVTVIGCILLLVPAVVMLVEVFVHKETCTDLKDIAVYIGAVAGVFTSAGITKVWSEKYEKCEKGKKCDKDDNNETYEKYEKYEKYEADE